MFYDINTDHARSTVCGEETHSVWEQEEEDTIDHVIFVIHGIGQQTERFGYFEQHMETIRKTTCEVLQARMPNRDINIQLIPIEWHKHIHEETDGCLENISLPTIPGMRLFSNDYLMDALYYLAKDRQQSIVTHVTRSFNDSYHEFMETHPTFNGNIGIFGYSLGGLITWDILAHQRPLETAEEQEQLDKMGLKVPRLDFKPQFLFGIGCPLGGFLNIRNQDPKLYHPDSSTIFENIYHPCDPLAYRVEPLYHPDCRHHDSVQVEAAIMPDPATPLITSLTGWMTSWFKKMNGKPTQELLPSCTPQSPSITSTTQHTPRQTPVTVNNTLAINTPSFDATAASYSNLLSDIDCPTAASQDEQMPLNVDESTDKATLLSSVGALFQYISPRASFDRDSAIGSDVDEEDEEEGTKDRNNHASDSSTRNIVSNSPSASNKTQMRISGPLSTNLVQCMNVPPPGIAATIVTDPMNDPSMLHRRRQSQIYATSSQFSVQKKGQQSHQILPNLNPPRLPISSLEEDAALLKSLPGHRRLDYSLKPESVLGGMVSNQYVLGLQAHFSYWNNKDMLWRMVYQLDNAAH